MLEKADAARAAVIRRVGGLEVNGGKYAPLLYVIRRVGGLEGFRQCVRHSVAVIRRVGGLEDRGALSPADS